VRIDLSYMYVCEYCGAGSYMEDDGDGWMLHFECSCWGRCWCLGHPEDWIRWKDKNLIPYIPYIESNAIKERGE